MLGFGSEGHWCWIACSSPLIRLGFIGVMYGLYWDDGKDNGNYYLGFRVLGFRAYSPP